MRITSVFLSVLLFLPGCSSLPVVHPIDPQKEYDVSFDDAWAGVLDYFTRHSIPIKTIEKVSGVVYAERISVGSTDLDPYADCGTYGLYTPQKSTIGLNIFVREDQSVVIRVNATFSLLLRSKLTLKSSIRFTTLFQEWTCTSRGVLEQQILNHVEAWTIRLFD